DTALSLHNLGSLLQAQGNLTGARPYYERALAIFKKARGEQHRQTAFSLNGLGSLLQAQGDLTGARPYYEQALAIRKKGLGARRSTPTPRRPSITWACCYWTRGTWPAPDPTWSRASPSARRCWERGILQPRAPSTTWVAYCVPRGTWPAPVSTTSRRWRSAR